MNMNLNDKRVFTLLFIEKLEVTRGVTVDAATQEDCYVALAHLIRDQVMKYRVQSASKTYKKGSKKQVFYFSLEFLLGTMLVRNMEALDLKEVCDEAMKDLGFNAEEIYDVELDPALGNGGLGRLAACFLDSLAFLGIPGNGCSIRYKYGLFEQKIVDGYQVELADDWLRNEAVWEIRKPSRAVAVKFNGRIREEIKNNRHVFYHDDYETVIAMPYDVPIPGYESGSVNTLRLWSAESPHQMDYGSFSSGDHVSAISRKYSAEAISEVLYPDDSNYQNRMLRLKQQYFFVSAGLQSIVNHYIRNYKNLKDMPDYIAVHINDTHPALAVPELMRILMDDQGMGWDEAWDITVKTISFTNHTLLPEALEKWPVDSFSSLLPRIYMIVHEINERFCSFLFNKFSGDTSKVESMAIIRGGDISMAYLAIVGSHAVNGVAAVHSELLKTQLFKNFYEVFPERFSNKTNGIAHRRWVHSANRPLSDLIAERIGDDWVKEPMKLSLLDKNGAVKDKVFLEEFAKIKRDNKIRLAKTILDKNGIKVNPDSIFDVQVKRIHAYKRQLLFLLYILDLYYALRDDSKIEMVPKTFIMSGKAAPSYYFAKEIIKLTSVVSEMCKSDPRIDELIKVVFLENYRVSLAEGIFPAADLSEQISTATMEASGTGNMKFMMNGAVTIGTYDGANIEIFEAVGKGNYIPFGLTVPDVLELRSNQSYNSREFLAHHPRLKRIVYEVINSSPGEVGRAEFPFIYDSLTAHNDEFYVMKDFDAYVEAQNKANKLYKNKEKWSHMEAMNIAHSGRFASDETIKKYAQEIWKV